MWIEELNGPWLEYVTIWLIVAAEHWPDVSSWWVIMNGE